MGFEALGDQALVVFGLGEVLAEGRGQLRFPGILDPRFQLHQRVSIWRESAFRFLTPGTERPRT